MKIINRYILGEFLQMVFLASSGLTFLFLLNLTLEDTGKPNIQDWALAQYLLFSFPKMWLLGLPFALLFAGVYTMAKIKTSKGLIVLESSGIPFLRIISPILLSSFFLLFVRPLVTSL